MRPPTYAALLAYRGHPFHGYQRQGELPTVEAALRAAIEAAAGQAPRGLVPASRTDAGVHALGQVISFRLDGAQTPDQLRDHINAALPGAIYLRHLWRAAPRFNARAQSLEKRYRYLIDTRGGAGRVGETCLRVEAQPRLDQMRAAAAQLLGTHDFSSFRASGCSARAPECHLRMLRVRPCGHLVAFDVEGDRFLRKMVRNLVGWLLDVGAGDRDLGETPEVLRARSRAAAGHTAPARGLSLLWVRYPPEAGSRSAGGTASDSR